jgi:hypothetical protein
MLHLPSRVIQLIHEYSLPVTRPDWKIFERKIKTTAFIDQIMNYQQHKIYKKKNIFKLVYNHMRETDFVIAYYYIYSYGIQMYIMKFGGEERIILSNKILHDRYKLYKSYVYKL